MPNLISTLSAWKFSKPTAVAVTVYVPLATGLKEYAPAKLVFVVFDSSTMVTVAFLMGFLLAASVTMPFK